MTTLTTIQQQQLIDLLWDSMKTDPEHPKDRVQTGWGTKTQLGLLACIQRIVGGDHLPVAIEGEHPVISPILQGEVPADKPPTIDRPHFFLEGNEWVIRSYDMRVNVQNVSMDRGTDSIGCPRRVECQRISDGEKRYLSFEELVDTEEVS